MEDNHQNMKLMEMVLGAKGYTLFKAFDGETAIKLATTEPPDLIIIDIQLPKISGLEVNQRLRQMPEFSHIPIIAITAYVMKGDREKLLEAGFNAYLPKPINTRELPRLISEMLLAPPKGKSGFEEDKDESEDYRH